MQSLVSDLLNFSRVGRAHNAHQSIGLVTVLEETLPALGVAVEETGAEITHAPPAHPGRRIPARGSCPGRT